MDCPVLFELLSGFLALFHLPRDDLGGLLTSVIKHVVQFMIICLPHLVTLLLKYLERGEDDEP